MEVNSALQKLAAYERRPSEKSQQILDAGKPLLIKDAFLKQGDEGMNNATHFTLEAHYDTRTSA